MRAGADQLAERTERQAAAISQAATAIQEITSAVRTQIARARRSRAHCTRGERGHRHVGPHHARHDRAPWRRSRARRRRSTRSFPSSMRSPSRPILLALNAGVEAARARRKREGFCSGCARGSGACTALLECGEGDCQPAVQVAREVDHGVKLVEKAGHALDGIARSHVLSINSHIGEIMESTREEAQTLVDINTSVNQLDSMTQQNAAMVEETTAAIHRLCRGGG